MAKVGLQAPWVTYRNFFAAMFKDDPEVTVGNVEDDEAGEGYVVLVMVHNYEKFLAMKDVVVQKVVLGNVTLTFDLQCDVDDEVDKESDFDKIKKVFQGNRIVKDFKEITDPAGAKHDYVLFWPEVVQFWNDDLSDFYGNWNGLAEDIARALFKVRANVNFCTADLRENADQENAE